MSDLIFGKNACLEALKSNRDIVKAYIINNKEMIDLLEKKKVPYKIYDRAKLDEIHVNNQGVIFEVMNYRYYQLDEIINDKNDSLIIMLDGLEDPHNLGAIVRTAEISGCDGVIIPKNRSVEVNSTVAKVSCGAIENVKVVQVVNLVQTINYLKKQGYWIVGTDAADKSVNYWEADYKMKVCLIIGSEGRGISRLVRESCDFLVKIPMWGKINSLNASVSTGIVIYEIRRQQIK